MRLIILSLTVFLSFHCAKGQDTISIIGSAPVLGKVVEISATEVKYKLFDFPTGPVYIAVRSAVQSIHYENGRIEDLTQSDTLQGRPIEPVEGWAEKGRRDARLFYEPRHTGAFWVGSATVLFTPLLGWIPALAVASFPPSEGNLNILDYNLRRNKSYYRSYMEEAHQIKKDKIWSTYGNVTLFMLMMSAPK